MQCGKKGLHWFNSSFQNIDSQAEGLGGGDCKGILSANNFCFYSMLLNSSDNNSTITLHALFLKETSEKDVDIGNDDRTYTLFLV